MKPAMVFRTLARSRQRLGRNTGLEATPIEALVAELAVEAFDKAVVPRLAWQHEAETHILVAQRGHNWRGSELRPFKPERMRTALPCGRINRVRIKIRSRGFNEVAKSMDKHSLPNSLIAHSRQIVRFQAALTIAGWGVRSRPAKPRCARSRITERIAIRGEFLQLGDQAQESSVLRLQKVEPLRVRSPCRQTCRASE